MRFDYELKNKLRVNSLKEEFKEQVLSMLREKDTEKASEFEKLRTRLENSLIQKRGLLSECAAVNLKLAQLEKQLSEMAFDRDRVQSNLDVYISHGGIAGVKQLIADRDATIEAMQKELDDGTRKQQFVHIFFTPPHTTPGAWIGCAHSCVM